MSKLENDISYDIRGAAFNVYNELGPGLLESVYESAMFFELTEKGRNVKAQVPVPVKYKGNKLQLGFRLDLLIDDRVVIELKSVEHLLAVHHKQLLTYLKLTDKRLGLLINFNDDPINIVRIVNGL